MPEEITTNLQRTLGFVPLAVLPATIFPELLQPGGSLDVSSGNERLLAGLAATAVAWRTKNVLWTIVIGTIVWFLLLLVLLVAFTQLLRHCRYWSFLRLLKDNKTIKRKIYVEKLCYYAIHGRSPE